MVIDRLFPILRTPDLPQLSGFYEQAFDAEVTYRYDHEGVDVYVALAVGGGQIGIGLEADIARGDAIAVWFYTDDVDATYAAALAAGAASVAPPEDLPWGERVAQVRDPDGNLLYVATAIRP
ncbi:VOC family protein [Microbacterium luteolum]|uniref:VOC family protein n=1 Tax=Microbacterium luteolum TaxID=69367 RepID=A0ABY7XP31_MICLT|nr:VOC family protein [Microbacterium luteolum]WDM43903.1 VOC family protein [Microbacterium luteolum]